MTVPLSPRAGALAVLLTALGAGCGAGGDRPGEGPAPAGSRLPQLSSTVDGETVLSWVVPDPAGHALQFARLQGDAWSDPVTVARGADWFVNWADVPSVVPLRGELWAAHWLVSQGRGTYAYDVALALSHDGGSTWQAPLRPYADDSPTEHGFVSIWPAQDAAGQPAAGLVWLDGRHMVAASGADHDAARTTLRSAVVSRDGSIASRQELDDRVCDCCPTAVAMTPEGPAIAYRDRTSREVRDMHVLVGAGGTWRGGPVAADGWQISGCPVNGPAIVSLDDALVIAWYTEAGGERRVRAGIRSGDGEWRAFDVARGNPLGRVGLAPLDADSAAVSWLQHAQDGHADIRLARVSRRGGVGPAVTVVSTRADRPGGIPRLARHDGELLLAWTHWDGETPRVVTRLLAASQLPPVD